MSNNVKQGTGTNKYLGFDDTWLIILGVPALGILMPLIFFGLNFSDSIGHWTAEILETTYYSAGYWFANRWMLIQLRKRYPTFDQVKKRILLQVVLSTFIAIVTGPILSPLHWVVSKLFNFTIVAPSYGIIVSASVLISYLILGIYETIYFYTQLKQSIEEKEAVKRLHLQSQWESLRNQVNPHFLFNSLNTLLNIVHRDPEQAEAFIKKLSKLYRFILESRKDPIIPLREELELAQSYAFLQKERFRPNLRIEFKIEEAYMSRMVVPLALQILIENAIKHNVISNKKPLRVEIFIDSTNQQIIVQNNLQRKRQVIHSTKVGLSNLQKRYQFFSKHPLSIGEEDGRFVVAIPLLNPKEQQVEKISNSLT